MLVFIEWLPRHAILHLGPRLNGELKEVLKWSHRTCQSRGLETLLGWKRGMISSSVRVQVSITQNLYQRPYRSDRCNSWLSFEVEQMCLTNKLLEVRLEGLMGAMIAWLLGGLLMCLAMFDNLDTVECEVVHERRW